MCVTLISLFLAVMGPKRFPLSGSLTMSQPNFPAGLSWALPWGNVWRARLAEFSTRGWQESRAPFGGMKLQLNVR